MPEPVGFHLAPQAAQELHHLNMAILGHMQSGSHSTLVCFLHVLSLGTT